MKYVKMLGFVTVVAAALAALAAPTSATVVTSPAGTSYTSTITLTTSHFVWTGPFTPITCTHSHMEGKIESHGSSSTAQGKVSKWSFSGCTAGVTVKKTGSLIIHATSGGSGTVTSSGAEIGIHSNVGECIFTTNETHIGTLAGGTGAKLKMESAVIPRTGGSFFCGSSGEWTGSYSITNPGFLSVD